MLKDLKAKKAAERKKMELRVINFNAAFGEIVEDAVLYEYPNGSWRLDIGKTKIADIHYYGLSGWEVQFTDNTYYGEADRDEILLMIGVPLSQKYPANGHERREASRFINK